MAALENNSWNDIPAGENPGDKGAVGADDLRKKLTERAFDVDKRPEAPEEVLRFSNRVIGTPGNIVCVQSGIKTGKSGLLGAINAAFMNGGMESGVDTLGFLASAHGGKAVLHWDTEQSRYDHDAGVRLSLKRCKRDSPPPWFHSWSVADLSIEERRAAIELAVEDAVKDHEGVACILIDGVADLVYDPNDSRESFETVAWLHALAIRCGCLVIVVIHENPGSEEGKTRGHLGSQLARKAESLVRLVKDSNEVTTIWVPQGRHGGIEKGKGLCFSWNQAEGIHMTVGSAGAVRSAAVRSKCAAEAEAAYAGDADLSYTCLIKRIKDHFEIKDRAAKGRLSKWAGEGVVRKGDSGSYRLTAGPI